MGYMRSSPRKVGSGVPWAEKGEFHTQERAWYGVDMQVLTSYGKQMRLGMNKFAEGNKKE